MNLSADKLQELLELLSGGKHLKSEQVIGKGYFPKELPPPFNTKKLATKLSDVKEKWDTLRGQDNFHESHKWRSKCSKYSISKGKLSRRVLGIPNPKHFIPLVELICENWDHINKVFNLSDFSISYPIKDYDQNKRAVKTKSPSVPSSREVRLSRSINKLVQARADISKFYPTIYSHSVTWSLLGKSVAKHLYKKKKKEIKKLIEQKDPDAKLYQLADNLDDAVRSCQDGQSVGLPIGPDTSHVLAELVACRIDDELKKELLASNIEVEAVRYYDDYFFYVNSKDEAGLVLKKLQMILNDFQLEINDKKVEVLEFPFAFEDDWVTNLHRFEFNEQYFSQSIRHYFSLLWGISKNNASKTDWILKYALRIFERRIVEVQQDSWTLFEDLLIKTTLIEPSVLNITTRILLTYQDYVNDVSKSKLKELIKSIIKKHAPLKHSFEVSWALWLAKSFCINIEKDEGNLIIGSKDSVSILMLLYLISEETLVAKEVNLDELKKELDSEALYSEEWLLTYEAAKKGWLNFKSSFIPENTFFKVLEELDIDFFDPNRQLEVYERPEHTSPNDSEIGVYDTPSEKEQKTDKKKKGFFSAELLEGYW